MVVPFLAPTSEPQTYVGCCVCQAVKFTVSLPSLESVWSCNCTFCQQRQLLLIPVKGDELKIERQPTAFGQYQFGSKTLKFDFCPTCGITFRAHLPSGDYFVNARMLQDLDTWSVKRDPLIDGESKPPAYQIPTFTGPAFDESDKGSDTYYGGCHCGAVTMAFRSEPPLEQRYLGECNCSYCARWGNVHCYPNASQVHLGGADNLTAYMATRKGKVGGSLFCKHCATQMVGVDDSKHALDGEGQPIPNAVEKVGHCLNVRAVNLRALRGVDYGKLKINKTKGRDMAPVFEVL